MIKSFDSYFINLLGPIASKSKDDSVKVGCIIVGEDNEILSTGWNGFSRGVDDHNPIRNERPTKYDYVVHAEANAICNAARSGVRLKGSTVYVSRMPCKNCIDLIIQSGIVCVKVQKDEALNFHNPEIYGFQVTESKINESGIKLEFI